MSGGCFIDCSEVRCRAYIFPGVINYPVTFLRMRDKRKPMCSVSRCAAKRKAFIIIFLISRAVR